MGTIGRAELGSNMEPDAEAVRAQLRKILKSGVFSQSARLSRFLSYGVEAALSGQKALNEYAIGIDVFERKVTFDSRIDPIVRVHARRLRSKLRQYYETEGVSDSIEISLPMRAYVPVFQVRTPRRPPRPSPSAFREDPALEDAIVVLPFINLNPPGEDDYFAAGLSEEVIHSLSKLGRWRIVVWSKAGRTRPELHEIAKEMDATAVLTGTVRRLQDRFRISIGLMSFPDRTVLWSQMYEAELEKLLSDQEKIAQEVSRELRLRAELQSARTGTCSFQAYKNYLKGCYWYRSALHEGLQKSKDHFSESLTADPEYALAHGALGEVLVDLALLGEGPPNELMVDAKREGQRAVEYGSFAYGQVVLGMVAAFHEWDPPAAEAAFLRAIDRNPRLSAAHQWYASALLAPTGRLDEAIAELERALEPEPLSIRILCQYALVLAARGYIDSALRHVDECLELDNRVALPLWTRAMVLIGANRITETIEPLERASEVSEASYAQASLAHAYAVTGRIAEAIGLLERLQDQSKNRYVPSIDLAMIHLGLRNEDKAFDYLEQARQQRCARLTWITIDPRTQYLRGDQRFESLIRGLRLTS